MEEIEDEIREQFEIFFYKKGPSPTSLHLPEERKLKRTYCQDITGKDFELVSKPVAAYPKGYRKICENCITKWKNER